MGISVSNCLKSSQSNKNFPPATENSTIKLDYLHSYSSNFTIGSLPEEILVEIFSYLSSRDLKTVSLTCKNFSNIINEFEEITKKFKLKLTIGSSTPGFFVLRKPYNVEVEKINLDIFCEIQEKISKFIKCLTIRTRSCDYHELELFLNLCDNLKELEVSVLLYNKFTKSDFSNLNLKLDKLTVGASYEVFEILKNCQVKELT